MAPAEAAAARLASSTVGRLLVIPRFKMHRSGSAYSDPTPPTVMLRVEASIGA
jgi:hypothetical protein